MFMCLFLFLFDPMPRMLFIRCAKGIFAKGIWGCTGFSLLRWEKGSETPSCGGEKGLRLPRSLGRSMRNEGVSVPLPHRRGSLRSFFPSQKGKPRTSPNPLSENPRSTTHHLPRPSKNYIQQKNSGGINFGHYLIFM